MARSAIDTGRKCGPLFADFPAFVRDKVQQITARRSILSAPRRDCCEHCGKVLSLMRPGSKKTRHNLLAAISLQLHPPAGAPSMKAEPAQLDHCVETALLKQPNVPQRNLRFEASEGRVTLHGTVHSYYQKQMAQEALRRLEGVQTIDNQIEVSWA
jgi:hypothetical protein